MSSDNSRLDKFPIRVNLDKDDGEKFLAIQEKFKLKNKSEVLRFCVNKVYYGLTIEIDNEISKEIQQIISSRHVKVKYAISNIDDFIRRAISEFLETLKDEWSLKNWSMRQTLSSEENDTALALLELQRKQIPGVTIEDLVEYLKKDQTDISIHIEKFISEALLDFRESQGKIYYYAR
ncbi:MAG: hypothetical protein ACFFFH_11890 [Candidatus Thorarchaeota archaeon]